MDHCLVWLRVAKRTDRKKCSLTVASTIGPQASTAVVHQDCGGGVSVYRDILKFPILWRNCNGPIIPSEVRFPLGYCFMYNISYPFLWYNNTALHTECTTLCEGKVWWHFWASSISYKLSILIFALIAALTTILRPVGGMICGIHLHPIHNTSAPIIYRYRLVAYHGVNP